MEEQPKKGFWQSSMRMVFLNKLLIVRALLSLAYYALVFYVVRILVSVKIEPDNKDILNIIMGAIVASFSLVTHYWFKRDDNDDREDKEKA